MEAFFSGQTFLESPSNRTESLMFYKNSLASETVRKSMSLAPPLVTLGLKKLKFMARVVDYCNGRCRRQSLYDAVIFELPPQLFYVTGSSLVRGENQPGTVFDTYVCIEVEGFAMHNLGYTGKEDWRV